MGQSGNQVSVHVDIPDGTNTAEGLYDFSRIGRTPDGGKRIRVRGLDAALQLNASFRHSGKSLEVFFVEKIRADLKVVRLGKALPRDRTPDRIRPSAVGGYRYLPATAQLRADFK